MTEASNDRAQARQGRKLRTLHRASAVALAFFIVLHITNHIIGLAGQPQHIAFMAAARVAYRYPFIEPILLALVLLQVVSGLRLLLHNWRARTRGVAGLQAVSGSYLALFIVIHVAAVLMGRTLGFDTDFRFAAVGFHVPLWPLFFAPYYFLATVALATHVGCALYFNLSDKRERMRAAILSTLIAVGGVLGLTIVLSLAGKLHAVDIPASYRSLYGR